MNRQCLSDFLHIPAVVSGNFAAIGMFSHGDEKINMSFPFSADHGEIIIFTWQLPFHTILIFCRMVTVIT